eukprot:TRINITY_DN31582_c0_g1_i1.p1 TRINITY_DN31582_c0_g1~~TRINITY_DN31582_c0_g1_i1.p1  ORF type:complete len:237 (+),score=54.10 TRINITY_DN31582_c0_g1_i1:86-796(+)
MAPSVDLAIGDRVGMSSTVTTFCGVVRYVGKTQFAEGDWVGVELDGPAGKNDGSVKGVRYFECRDKHGVFVRQSVVKRLAPPSGAPEEVIMEERREQLTPVPDGEQREREAAAAAYEQEWTLRFNEQQNLVEAMQTARKAVAKNLADGKQAVLLAEARERAATSTADEERDQTAAQLRRRVISRFGTKLDSLVQGTVAAAVEDAIGPATQQLALTVADLRQRRARRMIAGGQPVAA